MSPYILGNLAEICLYASKLLWTLEPSQRAWSLWLCFHRIIKYHSLSFTLKVQSHVSGVHTFKWGGEQPQSHCPIPQVGHSREGKREASSSSQEFCAWSAPFLLGFLNEHSFNCAGTVPVNVITLAFAQGLCHIYHEGRMCTGSSVSINSPHMMLSRVSVETV